MGENSKIEWTHHTFNPWWGCLKVSPACEHCYAETFDKRVGGHHWGPASTTPRRFLSEANWARPLKWNRDAEQAGERRRVFCASMADVFEDNDALGEARNELFKLIESTPWLDWLLLTKRPENIMGMIWPHMRYEAPKNIWYGTTVENQEYADKRIAELLKVPAVVRFLSCEPLLGPVDLRRWVGGSDTAEDDLEPEQAYCVRCGLEWDESGRSHRCSETAGPRIDWVITGGESGPHARPGHPDWYRSLRDQCQAAGVAFHFKQWGEWAPAPWRIDREPGESVEAYKARSEAICATHVTATWGHLHKPNHNPWSAERTHLHPDHAAIRRLGTKAAGRKLDGVEWNEFPAVAPS